MPETAPSSREHDTNLVAWFEHVEDSRVEDVFQKSIQVLNEDGFAMAQDAEHDRRYPSLATTHRVGCKGDLKVTLSQMGRTVEVQFHQDLVHENPLGGQHDFDKYAKAPYLLRMAYCKIRNRLDAAWQTMGLTAMQRDDRHITQGQAFICARENELNAFQHRSEKPLPAAYNSVSGARKTLSEQQTVYFNRRGRWIKGTAHHHINNMWWVLLPSGEVENKASFELFHREDLPANLQGRQVPFKDAVARLNRHLAQAVRVEAFEKASAMRDQRKKLERREARRALVAQAA